MTVIYTPENEYDAFVLLKTKSAEDIRIGITPEKAQLIHAAMGISGEAGELLDSIKKHCIYGKELDVENVIEELGDLEFYMSLLRSVLNVPRETTLNENVSKLERRYSRAYTDAEAIGRVDKC